MTEVWHVFLSWLHNRYIKTQSFLVHLLKLWWLQECWRKHLLLHCLRVSHRSAVANPQSHFHLKRHVESPFALIESSWNLPRFSWTGLEIYFKRLGMMCGKKTSIYTIHKPLLQSLYEIYGCDTVKMDYLLHERWMQIIFMLPVFHTLEKRIYGMVLTAFNPCRKAKIFVDKPSHPLNHWCRSNSTQPERVTSTSAWGVCTAKWYDVTAL